MLKVLTTASNEIERDLLLARLRDAGIGCMHSPGGPRSGLSGGRDILVEEHDISRAREVLQAEQGDFDDDELARLSDEAGRRANQNSHSSQPTPTDDPKGSPASADDTAPNARRGLGRAFERLALGRRRDDAPDNPFGR